MYSEIASNQRRTILFVVLFFVVWLAIGGLLGFLFRAVDHPSVRTGFGSAPATNSDWAPVVIGVVVGGLLAIIGILYSVIAGARLVLRTSGAVPADPGKYRDLHDVVGAL